MEKRWKLRQLLECSDLFTEMIRRRQPFREKDAREARLNRSKWSIVASNTYIPYSSYSFYSYYLCLYIEHISNSLLHHIYYT